MVYVFYFTILTVGYFVGAAVVIIRHYRSRTGGGGGGGGGADAPVELQQMAPNLEEETLSNGKSPKV